MNSDYSLPELKRIAHPEIQEGEEFLLNVTVVEFERWQSQSDLLGMSFLRLGNQAYEFNSLTPVHPLLQYRPMFGKPRKGTR